MYTYINASRGNQAVKLIVAGSLNSPDKTLSDPLSCLASANMYCNHTYFTSL